MRATPGPHPPSAAAGGRRRSRFPSEVQQTPSAPSTVSGSRRPVASSRTRVCPTSAPPGAVRIGKPAAVRRNGEIPHLDRTVGRDLMRVQDAPRFRVPRVLRVENRLAFEAGVLEEVEASRLAPGDLRAGEVPESGQPPPNRFAFRKALEGVGRRPGSRPSARPGSPASRESRASDTGRRPSCREGPPRGRPGAPRDTGAWAPAPSAAGPLRARAGARRCASRA